MQEVLEKLKGVRSIKAKALRSRIEAALVRPALYVCSIAFVLLLVVVMLAKGQQYGLLPYQHWAIDAVVIATFVCLGLAVTTLSALLLVGLCSVRKSAYEALLVEAKYDRNHAESCLLVFKRGDLLSAKAFLQSKAADIQERTTSFYGGGAVFLLALATAAWAISKDLLGEQRLRELTTAHIANAAPAIIASAIGLTVIIAVFRPLKSIYAYHVRLIEIALALQDRSQAPIMQPTNQRRRCRFRRGTLEGKCNYLM